MRNADKVKPVEMRIDPNGGVRVVDMEAFFAQPKVQETIKKMKEMDLVEKKT